MTCVHCGRPKVNRPRGMCYPCYYSPARELYSPVSKYGRRGVLNGHRNGTLPTPTTARPGTREKLAVLAERAKAGHRLWHPLDAIE